MKKPTHKGGSKHLEEDDHALWNHTARSVTPLARAKGRHHPAAEEAKDRARHAAETQKSKHDAKAKAVSVKPVAARTPAKPQPKAPPPLAAVDRKRMRRIRTGRVEIEARIDLHGMRQSEAHEALVRFLLRCQGRDRRWVLVITGKGKASDDDRYAPFELGRHGERGVLKRNVPRWLDEPELRSVVLSYTTAATAHGGEGALYVHLRKRR